MAAMDVTTEPRLARARVGPAQAPPSPRPAPLAVAVPGTEATRPVHGPTRTSTLASPPRAASRRGRERRRHTAPWLLGAVLAGLVAGGAVAAVTGTVGGAGGPTGPDPAQALASIQRLGVVSTGATRVSKTFDVSKGDDLLGTNSSLTYEAVGSVAATVDLTGVSRANLTVAGTRVSVTIPAAQLGTPVFDAAASRVVSRARDGILTGVFDNGVTSSDARAQAPAELADAAQTAGLPTSAERAAIAEVQSVLRRLGARPAVVAIGP